MPKQLPPEPSRPEHPGMSWAAMLCIVILTICAAVGIAYRLVFPFFHAH